MTNLAHYFGTGLKPDEFVARMTKNQDKFQDWQRRFEWSDPSDQAFFEGLHGKGLHCVLIAADWCGDVVRNVPVVFHALAAANIPTDVMIMEDHLDLMDQYLTMGGRSIPVVLFVNDSGELLGKWGPRPAYVQEPMVAFKANHPDRNAPDYEDHLKAARQEIMARYGEGTEYQALIIRELRDLLGSL